MKILHITQYCHTESIGGTERYILDLIRGLEKQGHESAIGWLTSKAKKSVVKDAIRIFPLPGTPMRVDRPSPDLLSVFDVVAGDFPPGIIHFHTFGRNEAALAQWAILHGIPYVFTYHSPGWTCRREDLMAFDRPTPCDGEVRVFRCSACKIHERVRKVPAWIAWLATIASIPFSILLAQCSQTRFRRRTAFLADTRDFRRALRTFLENCRLIFACAEWSVPLLLSNGASKQTIELCPQGVSSTSLLLTGKRNHPTGLANETFNIGYVGRVVPVKGVDILVDSFNMLAAKDVRLYIYGWPDVAPENDFYDSIQMVAEKNTRIQLVPRLPMTELMKRYGELDLLCIPSVWPETGPLVLFEALQCGVPVYGTGRVGQLKLLQSRGLVVEPNTREEWYKALLDSYQKYCSGQWDQARTRAFGAGELRTMADVAGDVAVGYASLNKRSR